MKYEILFRWELKNLSIFLTKKNFSKYTFVIVYDKSFLMSFE